MDEIPIVHPRETAYHYVVRCPYCHEEHWHGKKTGHRVSHCWGDKARLGYIIKLREGNNA